MIKFKVLTYISILVALLSSSVSADILSPFFTKNGAKSLFATKISQERASDYVLLPKKKITLVDENQDIKEEAAEIFKALKSNTSKDESLKEDKKVYASAEEELLDKFGNPFESPEINAIKDAPKPFQAMVHALRMGEDELAFKYAVQYVRYQRDMKLVNDKALSMIGQGYVREGMLPEKSWASNPQHQEYFYLRNVDLGEPKKEDSAKETINKYSSKLNKKAQEIIARSKQAKFELIQNVEKIDTETLELDEDKERRQARIELKGRIPVDPKGQVDIYFFFNTDDMLAIGLGKDLNKLSEFAKGDEKLEFTAMTIKGYGSSKVKTFKYKSGIDFDVLKGAVLAKQMGITNSPSFVFVTRNSLQFYKLDDLKSFYYITELIKIMKGEV